MRANSGKPAMASLTMTTILKRRAAGLATGFLLLAATITGAQADQSVLGQGNAVVTGFSGTAPAAAPAASGDPLDALFIDLNGASARILNVQTGGQPAQGQVVPAPTVLAVKAGDVGQVFGIALDDGKGADGTASGTPDIYLTATSAFGLQIVATGPNGAMQRLKAGQPGAQFMSGQWGNAANGATPGSIWKVSGTTGAVSLFANVELNSQPNSGPGLGNIAFDAKSRQIFASDLETGMIHRFDMHGQDLGFFDHGTQGRVGQGLAPVPYDPANRLDITNPAFSVNDATTWHMVQKGRMVWGLKVSAGRLYYATAEGPQVWSISIGDDGSFGSDSRMEIDVTGTTNGSAISDLTFDGPNSIYLAQRGAAEGDYSYKTFADPAKSDVIRYHRDPQTAKWTQVFEEYAVGFPPDNRNTNGGVAIDTCNSLVWTTGEVLRQGAGLGDPENIHGLQGMDKSLVRPANVPPKQSYFAEYNPAFEQADSHGHMGDVEIFHACAGQQQGSNPPVIKVPTIPNENLSLTKTGSDCVALNNAPDFACHYTITVTSTGSGTFHGPIQIDDMINTKFGSPTFDPPWICTLDKINPQISHCVLLGVTLAPGQSVTLQDTMPVQHGDLSSTSCQLKNTAIIVVPPGGTEDNTNPLDDSASATDLINNPNCIPVPPGNLTLVKTSDGDCVATNNAPDFQCGYTITITNTGTAPFSGQLQFADVTNAKFGVPTFDPSWTCTFDGGAKTSHCSQTVSLAPGAAVTAKVSEPVQHGDLSSTSCNVQNTATIEIPVGGSVQNLDPSDDTSSATDVIKNPNCIPPTPPAGPNLAIKKIGDPCTDTGGAAWQCNFLVTIANTTNVDFSGPVAFDDTTTFGTLTASTPGWTCTNSPPPSGNDQHSCSNPSVSIPANSSVGINMTVVTPGGTITLCRQDNVVHIQIPLGGSATNTDPSDDTAAASASVPNPICTAVPPPPAPPLTNLSLVKTATPECVKNAKGNFDCSYVVTLTNTGPGSFFDTISFEDSVDNFSKGKALGAVFGGTIAWNCLPDPANPGVFVCISPSSVALAPGQSVQMTAVFEESATNATPDSCKFSNAALIVSPPAGTLDNSVGSDDFAGATAKIPMVVDPVLGTVPCDPPALKLTKVAEPQLCAKVAGGFQCTYKVSVASVGPDPFHGPLTIQETLPAGSSLVKSSSDWPCTGSGTNLQCKHAFVTIPVGTSLDMSVTVLVPDSAASSCTATNKVKLAFGSGALAGKTYEASATATIQSPLCLQTPLVDGNNGHVSILKKCEPSAVGAAISCKITVTNDGRQPITTAISFGDHGQWSGNGSPMRILTANPDSPAITCGGLPDNLNCTLPGSALPPGASHSVEVELAADRGQSRYKNCARLQSVNGSPLTGPGHESCFEGGGDISIVKSGPATCTYGSTCTFQIAITNNSDAAFRGPLLVGDVMQLGGAGEAHNKVAISPPLGCGNGITTLPFNCAANTSLAPHETQMHTIAVQMPQLADGGAPATSGINCAFATDGSAAAAGRQSLPSIAANSLRAGNGPGYSCVPFNLIVQNQPAPTCPGDEVRIGTQCQCPPDTRYLGNFRCSGGGGTVIVPVPVPLPTCNSPRTGTFANCHCPDNKVYNAHANSCDCPKGMTLNDAGKCVTPKPHQCSDTDKFGVYPVCCTRDLFYNGSCHDVKQAPICTNDGDPNNHCCTSNQQWDKNRQSCETNVAPKCSDTEKFGVYPVCCTRDLFYNGSCHDVKQTPICTNGGDPNNHCCTSNQHWDKNRQSCETNHKQQCSDTDKFGNYPACCTKDYFYNGSCHDVKQTPACTNGGDPNNHCCTSSQYWDPRRNSCETNVTNQCSGQTPFGVYPTCCTVFVYRANGSSCTPKQSGTTGTTGTTGNKACPSPATGTRPNCTCPANDQPWNGESCLPKVPGNGNTGTTGGTGNTHGCPTGEKWNGSACAKSFVLPKFKLPGLTF